MRYKLDHVAFKVRSIETTVSQLSIQGVQCEHVGYYPEVGMQIGFVKLKNTLIELLEPVDACCPIWEDPQGLHHIGLAVDDVHLWYRQLMEEGLYFKPEPLRKGRHGDIFFFRLAQYPQWLFECL
ncbi:MAG: VOC family protein [Bacteroidales bacterium]